MKKNDLDTDIAALGVDLKSLLDRVNASNVASELIVINDGDEAWPGSGYAAALRYPGLGPNPTQQIVWERASKPDESKEDFYARITKEARQRNGRLAVCGGLPPETDGEDDWTIVDAR